MVREDSCDDRHNRKFTRRTVLAGTTAAPPTAFRRVRRRSPPRTGRSTPARSSTVNLTKSPRGDNLQKYEKEFTDLTGIQVSSEQTPEQQQRQKAVIELNSGSPSFDVIHISYHVQKRQFEKANWLADCPPS